MVIATTAVAAAGGAALSSTEPDRYEATAQVMHGDAPARAEVVALARSDEVARRALARAGAGRTTAEDLIRQSDVELTDERIAAFTVRDRRPRVARRVATAYAEAYLRRLPAGQRATSLVRPAGPAERSREPGSWAAVGAAIGLAAGLLLAFARDALGRRRTAAQGEAEPESEPEPQQEAEREPPREPMPVRQPESAPRPEPQPGLAAAAPMPADRDGQPIVDLHCHILPGIDDGPRTTAESLELGCVLVSAGVKVVAATPHLRADHPAVVPEELGARCAELQARLAQDGVALEIITAGELDLYWALAASEEELRLVSYGGRGSDVLLETPYDSLPPTFEDDIAEVSSAGFRVTLAHPERNPSFQQDPERLSRIVDRGALVQVTASSLLKPSRRSRSARLARRLLQRGEAHILASDAHDPRDGRVAALAPAIEAAQQLAREHGSSMVRAAPAAVLAGEPLPGAAEARR